MKSIPENKADGRALLLLLLLLKCIDNSEVKSSKYSKVDVVVDNSEVKSVLFSLLLLLFLLKRIDNSEIKNPQYSKVNHEYLKSCC